MKFLYHLLHNIHRIFFIIGISSINCTMFQDITLYYNDIRICHFVSLPKGTQQQTMKGLETWFWQITFFVLKIECTSHLCLNVFAADESEIWSTSNVAKLIYVGIYSQHNIYHIQHFREMCTLTKSFYSPKRHRWNTCYIYIIEMQLQYSPSLV